MRFVWLFFLLELFVYALIKPLISDHEVGLLILILLSIVTVLVFITKFKGILRVLFYVGFVMRFVVMLVDIYLKNIIKIPHSGADTEGFLRRAVSISGEFDVIIQSNYEFFIKVVGFIFTITGNERIIVQYFNVLLGFTTIYIMYLILKQLNFSRKNRLIGISIVIFFPHSIFFSGILLREMLSAFFVISSLYFLIKWYNYQSKKDFVFSILMILLSALFHSGVIGLLLMHIFILIFYNTNTKRLVFTFKSIIMFLVLAIFTIGFFGFSDWSDWEVFSQVSIESVEDIYETSSSRLGGSVYLTNLSINNIFEFFIYGPIFIIYFISSPLPLDWRGFNDVLSFSLDGIYYLGVSIYTIFNYKKVPREKRTLLLILIIGLVSTLFIFGTGVQNAGTALRHRHKLFYLFTLILIMIKEFKIKDKREIMLLKKRW